MWNRWKRAIVGRPPSSRATRPPATLPDLFAVPVLPVGDPRGLGAVALSVMSDYLGRHVVQVQRVMMDSRTANQEVQRWRITFEDGTHAELGLNMIGATNSEFSVLRSRFLAQQDSAGQDSGTDQLSVDTTGRVGDAPYEMYYRGTILAARGTRHDAVVVASGLDSPRRRGTMAGLAVLALRLLDE